jgi:hypothetical protein
VTELEDFFTTIWGDQHGTVCLAFKTSEGKWKDEFFQWPGSSAEAVQCVAERDLRGEDCYFAPAVLHGPSRRKVAFKSSNVAWVDHDGGSPDQLPVPPSLLVETSPNRFHAYWLLEETATSAIELEKVNKALQELSGADPSGYDATQILRVPGTLSKKRHNPVVLVQSSAEKHHLGDFPKLVALLTNLLQQSNSTRQGRFSESLTIHD